MDRREGAPTIERKKLDKVITVPGMVTNMRKAISNALRNPVDIQLDMYSSKHPELLNPLDLKMMSKLDRLRKHSELRILTKQQKGGLDKDLLKLQKIEQTNKALKEKKQKEQINSQQKATLENAK